MAKFKVEVSDYGLAAQFGEQILVGSAFAFVAPASVEDKALKGLQNFYGTATIPRRIVPLLPDGTDLPGFTLTPQRAPLKVAPVLLPDKEIYRAGKDTVRLLVVVPKWAAIGGKVKVGLDVNGGAFRSQEVDLSDKQLALLEFGGLPEGNYRAYLSDAPDYEGNAPEAKFSVVEYTLAPLAATLLSHTLKDGKLSYRLKVESYNEPISNSLIIELWSGGRKFDSEKIKPGTAGIFAGNFNVKKAGDERLELRVSHDGLTATALIPGSRKAERDVTLISSLGTEVFASMQPDGVSREVRGLYLNSDGMALNTPVVIENPAPENGKAVLRWRTSASVTRVLVLSAAGKLASSHELSDVKAGQTLEIEVPAPAGFVAVGAWLGDKAFEGWASLLAPSNAKLEIVAPPVAKPGTEVILKLNAEPKAEIFVLVRDNRLTGSTAPEKLASSLKMGYKGASEWGTNGYVTQKASALPELVQNPWNGPGGVDYRVRRAGTSANFMPQVAFSSAPPMPAPMQPMMFAGAVPAGAMAERDFALDDLAAFSFGEMSEIEDAGVRKSSEGNKKKESADPRQDFADVAYAGVLKADTNGLAALIFKLPDAITTYNVEAFALSGDGADWKAATETLEANLPLWAEFRLPAFLYPGDKSPASLDINASGGRFQLALTRDGQPVTYTLSGATQAKPDVFTGKRAKVTFEASPGIWRAHLTDLTTDTHDAVEREVVALGKFKSLARRFQVLTPGETLKVGDEIVGFRLLPSLDKPFNLLCDATTGYSHKCCEQTAAKLLAAVAALVSGNAEPKLHDVILAGVAREKTMFVRDKGFMMYPPNESGGNTSINDYWGKLAAEHLRDLGLVGGKLSSAENIPADVRTAIAEAGEMGQNAARAYNLPGPGATFDSPREAYRAVASGTHQSEALAYARKFLDDANQSQDAVLQRYNLAWATATLLRGGLADDLKTAVGAANKLAAALGESGMLYSTVDSTAFICMLIELKERGIGAGAKGKVRLDGQELTTADAITAAERGNARELSVLEGAALAEVTAEVVEDWDSFRAEINVGVKLEKSWLRSIRVGDDVELIVRLDNYEPGLLAHICLPPSLAKIEGGGEVKRFQVDFAGKKEIRVPLRATAHTLPGGEHWALLVRNMFKEEQAGSPGVQKVQVSAD
jgi:hypothetical protein